MDIDMFNSLPKTLLPFICRLYRTDITHYIMPDIVQFKTPFLFDLIAQPKDLEPDLCLIC